MAISENKPGGAKSNPIPEANATQAQTKQVKQDDALSGIPILGYGNSRAFTTMSDGLGAEYTGKITEELRKVYAAEDSKSGYKISVNVLDKEVMTNLAYSAIVTSVLRSGTVAYFIMVLEATGRKPITGTEIMNEIHAMEQMGNRQRPNLVYVTSDAIDTILYDQVLDVITKEHPNVKSFISVDATVVTHYLKDISEATIRPVASVAFNACKVELGARHKEFRDFNITAAKQESPNTVLRCDTNLISQTLADAVGNPIRADFNIELSVSNTQGQFQSLNLQDGKKSIVRATGFVDAIASETAVTTIPGMPAIPGVRLMPHIIITNTEVELPTTGYSLLALISGMLMVKPSMWLACVAPRDAKLETQDPSMLNLVTNLENNDNGIGEPLGLSAPDLHPNEVFTLLKKMFALDAVVSMDVPVYGVQTHYTSVFSLAAAPGLAADEYEAKVNAGKEIIATAAWLTNGIFPSDFNPNDIFVNSGVTVPLGRWTDKDGVERDIREIDLAFIATRSGDTNMLSDWSIASLPHNEGGLDSYITKVRIISELVPNAVITGKAVRVMFSPAFLVTLVKSATDAGLDVNYKPIATFNEGSSLSAIGNSLANAGIGAHAVDFAHAYDTGGVGYQTPYNTGGRRIR